MSIIKLSWEKGISVRGLSGKSHCASNGQFIATYIGVHFSIASHLP